MRNFVMGHAKGADLKMAVDASNLLIAAGAPGHLALA